MKRLITLRNDFHNTEINVRADVDEGSITLTPSQIKRVERALCGMDCTCSGPLGVRGPQNPRIRDIEIDRDYYGITGATLYLL
jgi:hypothetical protein